MKKILSLLLALVMILSLVACGGDTAEDGTGDDAGTADDAGSAGGEGTEVTKEDLKVAIILPGTINDRGWTFSAYEGLLAIEESYGCEINYIESTPVTGAEEAFRNYATSGYNVIFGHGSEYYDAAAIVAEDFPDVSFIVTSTDYSNGTNCASVNTLPTQMGFLAGVAAAYATESKIVGAIGSVPFVSIVDALNGYIAGVKSVDPSIKVLTNMTGDDTDTVKTHEVALAMMEQGADVIMNDANAAGQGVIEACNQMDCLYIACIADHSDLAPDTCILSSCNALGAAMDYVVGKVLDGTFTGQFYPLGCEANAVYYVKNEPVWNEALSAEGQAAVQAAFDDFAANPGAEYVNGLIAELVPADELLV